MKVQGFRCPSCGSYGCRVHGNVIHCSYCGSDSYMNDSDHLRAEARRDHARAHVIHEETAYAREYHRHEEWNDSRTDYYVGGVQNMLLRLFKFFRKPLVVVLWLYTFPLLWNEFVVDSLGSFLFKAALLFADAVGGFIGVIIYCVKKHN